MLRHQRLQRNDTGWGDLFIFLRRNFDLGGFFLSVRKSSADTSVEASNDFILLRRGHSDEDGNSITEKDHERAGLDSKGHRGCRQHVVPLESGRIETIAKQKSPDGDEVIARPRRSGLQGGRRRRNDLGFK